MRLLNVEWYKWPILISFVCLATGTFNLSLAYLFPLFWVAAKVMQWRQQ